MRLGPLLVVFLDALDFLEFLVPSLLKRPRHQAILGFDSVILSERALGLVLHSFDLQLPVFFFLEVVLLYLTRDLERSLNILTVEDLDQARSHGFVHRLSREREAHVMKTIFVPYPARVVEVLAAIA